MDFWTAQCNYYDIEGKQELMEQENECYGIECDDDNKWVIRKRMNATEWEKRTNNCMKHVCDNSSGFISWSLCNSSQETSLICIDGECIKNETLYNDDERWIVEIEIEGININYLNTTELAYNISTTRNVEVEDMKIGVEIDEDGQVIRIVVIVKDKDSAIAVESSLKEILGRNVNSVRIITPELTLSSSYHTVLSVFLLSFILFISSIH